MDSFIDLFSPTDSTLDGESRVDKDVAIESCSKNNDRKDNLPDQLPSEPQEGNIEYKLKLLNPNKERFKRLVSQVSSLIF